MFQAISFPRHVADIKKKNYCGKGACGIAPSIPRPEITTKHLWRRVKYPF